LRQKLATSTPPSVDQHHEFTRLLYDLI